MCKEQSGRCCGYGGGGLGVGVCVCVCDALPLCPQGGVPLKGGVPRWRRQQWPRPHGSLSPLFTVGGGRGQAIEPGVESRCVCVCLCVLWWCSKKKAGR